VALSLIAVIAMLSPLLILSPWIFDSRPPRHWQPAALVASATLALVVTTGFLVSSYMSWEPVGITYETAANESRTQQLEDGTVIALGAQSELRIAFTNKRRVVRHLKGEVTFDVAVDARRPFIVTTFLADLEHGTKFRVLVDSGVLITVDKGIVVVHPRGDSSNVSIEVKAGSFYRLPVEGLAGGLRIDDLWRMQHRGA
jgi:transmembrane sensor